MAIPNDEVFLKKKVFDLWSQIIWIAKVLVLFRDLSADHGIKADQHGWLPGIPNRA